MKPVISVIIAAYNAEKTLKACLDSVFDQDFDSYEVILVNDGSTDDTAKMLDEYAARGRDFKVLHQGNKGPSHARNRGMALANGRFLLFLDADDMLAPGALDSLGGLVEDGQYDFIEFDYIQFKDGTPFDKVLSRDPERGFFRGISEGSGQDLFVDWIDKAFFWTSANSRIYSTDFLRRHGLLFPEGVFFEDTIWTPRVFKLAQKAKYEPVLVYLRRLDRQGSTMYKYRTELDPQQLKDRLFIAKALYELSCDGGNTSAFSHTLQRMACSVFFKACTRIWIESDASFWNSMSADFSQEWHLLRFSPSWKIKIFYFVTPLIGMRNMREAFLVGRLLKNFLHGGKGT